MADKLTPEEIVRRIEVGFPGYTTVAEIWDYRFRFRFQVRSMKDRSVLLTVPDQLIHDFDTEQALEQLLNQSRKMIADKENPRPATFQTTVGSSLRGA